MLEPTFAVAPLVVKPINDLYDLIKDKITEKLSSQAIKKAQATLADRIESVQKVKTIYKGDSAINLREFYYPTKVAFSHSSKRINYISEISTTQNIVLQGTVGQGKSVFMRFMTSQEIKREERIPVFFELRNLLKDETLEHAIISTLNKWLFKIDESLFHILAETGKLVFFLDGFDEIPSEYVKGVIRELEHWSEKYPALQIVISSRPDSNIEASNFFEVYGLQPYDLNDQLGLIRKLIEANDNFEQVEKALKASSTEIKNLLKTPLMVTLFVMTYRAKQIIPESMSDFYDDIFQVLMHRHDKTKPGFIRELKSSLNEKQLQEVFELFCFLSKKESLLSFKRQKFLELIKVCLEKTNQTGQDPSKIIEDISKNLCLVVQDGTEYSFIHKSIQEFFVANFIKNLPENNAKKIYQHLRYNHGNYKIEILFLESIDQYKFNKFLLIPELEYVKEGYGLHEPLNMAILCKKIHVILESDRGEEEENVSGEKKIFFIKPVNEDEDDFNLSWGENAIADILMRTHCLAIDSVFIKAKQSFLLEKQCEEETASVRGAIIQSSNLKKNMNSLLAKLHQARLHVQAKEDVALLNDII